METPQYQIMRQVEDTHFWYTGMRRITSSLLDSIHLPPQTSILDAGCGTGGNIPFLANYGHVTGVDISRLALKFCAERGLKHIFHGSIDALPFKDNSFDLVTCFDVLGHKLVNQTKAIGEFYRVLKPDGLLFIRVATYPWLSSKHDQVVHNERRYTKKSLRQLTSQFLVLRVTYANLFLFPLIAFKRLASNLTIKNSHTSDTKSMIKWLNYLLNIPFYIESWLLRYFDLPFGLSLILIARKPPKSI